jgi:hypothetical protein
MPPNEQALAKALEALQQVELESFTATPATIAPFGSSELRWRVSAPTSVRLELDGRKVARSGSQVVRPTTSRTFSLVARAGTLSSVVGQRTVVVNLDACALIAIPEADVQARLLEVIDGLLAQDEHLSLRSPPVVDVTPAGIVMKLRFHVDVENFRNPEFNVDALIGLAVDGEGIRPFFLQFSAELDFSFFEEALNIAIDATAGTLAGGPFIHLAFADAESDARENARRDILDGIRAGVAEFLLVAPAGWSPHQVFLRDEGIDVRICPRPGQALIDSFRHPGFRLTAARRGAYGRTLIRTGSKKGRRTTAATTPARRGPKRSVRRGRR